MAPTLIAILAVIALAGVIVYLLRNRITELNLDFLKGLIKLNSASTRAPGLVVGLISQGWGIGNRIVTMPRRLRIDRGNIVYYVGNRLAVPARRSPYI